jgi:hypothetical protein
MQEKYKGHQIIVTPLPALDPIIGGHGAIGRNWEVSVDGQDVTSKVSYIGIRSVELVMISAKRYVDKNFL